MYETFENKVLRSSGGRGATSAIFLPALSSVKTTSCHAMSSHVMSCPRGLLLDERHVTSCHVTLYPPGALLVVCFETSIMVFSCASLVLPCIALLDLSRR
jgi:hypothetical protein